MLEESPAVYLERPPEADEDRRDFNQGFRASWQGIARGGDSIWGWASRCGGDDLVCGQSEQFDVFEARRSRRSLSFKHNGADVVIDFSDEAVPERFDLRYVCVTGRLPESETCCQTTLHPGGSYVVWVDGKPIDDHIGVSAAERSGWEYYGRALFAQALDGLQSRFVEGTSDETNETVARVLAADQRRQEALLLLPDKAVEAFDYFRQNVVRYKQELLMLEGIEDPNLFMLEKESLMVDFVESFQKGTLTCENFRYGDFMEALDLPDCLYISDMRAFCLGFLVKVIQYGG